MYVCSLLDDNNNVLIIRGINHKKYSQCFKCVPPCSSHQNQDRIEYFRDGGRYHLVTSQSTLLSPPSEKVTVLMLQEGRVTLTAWWFTDKPDWQTKGNTLPFAEAFLGLA